MVEVLNELSTDGRLKSDNIICFGVIPGKPTSLDSFKWPLMLELSTSGAGDWTYDAYRDEMFLLRAHVIHILADQIGSAKATGAAGHTAYVFCPLCPWAEQRAGPVTHRNVECIADSGPGTYLAASAVSGCSRSSTRAVAVLRAVCR